MKIKKKSHQVRRKLSPTKGGTDVSGRERNIQDVFTKAADNEGKQSLSRSFLDFVKRLSYPYPTNVHDSFAGS